MSRTITVLLILLAIQCAAVVAVYRSDQATETASRDEVMLPVDHGDIDRLTIGDEFDNETVLVRSGDRWVIPGLHGLPADSGRVDSLLRGLATGNHGWPIAQSPTAQQRFQVADSNYQRRLELAGGGGSAGILYFGTSPGFGKVHARNGEQDAIFSIALNNFDIPAVAGKWLDPRLLQVRVPIRIDTDLYHLRLEDAAWRTANGKTPDEATLLTLLTALKTIQVLGVADEDQARQLAGMEADLIMTVESLAGTQTFELLALDDQHFIHSSEYPLFFRIGQPDYTRLADIDVGLITAE